MLPGPRPSAPAAATPAPARPRLRLERGALTPVVATVLGAVVTAVFLWQLWSHVGVGPPPLPATEQPAGPALVPTGWVVDATTGRPVRSATATLLGTDGTAASREDGSFALDLNIPRLVRVTAPGYAPRVLAVGPEEPARVSLSPESAGSLSLRFAGDTMLGRRFYEGTTDSRPWLREGAGVAAHFRPLRRIAPLLADADLTVVNLETSLIDRPHFSGARPARFHPTKDLVFASAPETAQALRRAGVDVVDLGNNHVYDALDGGLDATIRHVEAAGLAHFGAGRTLDEAWAPAYVQARGQTVAFIGCTTVRGDQHPIEYVVTPTQGGAAPCTASRMRSTVAVARDRADVVVVMMHGGTEYVEAQDAEVRDLSRVAAEAGATLVVNGHPHVVGGITRVGDTVVAETMGNLLFDQNLWSTLRSYLLRVDLTGDRPVQTTIDPFAITDYAPVPTTGALADSSARAAAGLLPGPMLLTPGSADSAPGNPAGTAEVTGARGSVLDLPSGTWLPPGRPEVTAGRDLLFGTGTFEKMDVGPPSTQPLLWRLGKYTRARREAACGGELGLRVIRQEGAYFDVVATPVHRIPVTAGDRITLSALVREATPGSTLELRWYDAMTGASSALDTLDVADALATTAGAGACRQVRLDVTVPSGAIAVQPFLRAGPHGDDTRQTEMLLDDVRLVQWASPGSGGRLYDMISLDRTDRVTLTRDGR